MTHDVTHAPGTGQAQLRHLPASDTRHGAVIALFLANAIETGCGANLARTRSAILTTAMETRWLRHAGIPHVLGL